MTRSTEDEPGGPPDAQGQETLAQYLARAGRLPVLQGQALAVQLLAAVDASHRQGRSHGDLSTSNILVTRNGRLLLPKEPEGVVGHQAREPDRDLVDAAKVAFELLTGARPSERDPAASSVRAWRPELPHDVDAVFDRAMAGPDGGFRSVARFSQALQAAMPAPLWDRSPVASSPNPQSVAMRPVAPAKEQVAAAQRANVPRFAPRRVALVACAAFAVLGAAAVAALHPEQWREPTQLRAEVPPSDTAAMGQRSAEQVVPEEPREPAIAPAASSADVAAEGDDVAEPAAPEPPPASIDRKAHKTGSRIAGREAKAHASTARQSRRPAPLAVASVDRRWRAGPDEQCRRDSALAADLCVALRCATADFRQHPVCVRMHGEAARARARLAEAMGGP